jgi:hypothetical protein
MPNDTFSAPELQDPDWIQPYKRLFIGPLANSELWEVRLQIVRTLPLLRWDARERQRVLAILRENLAHRQKFVRAWALDSLALVAGADGELLAEVDRGVSDFEASGVCSLEARARTIRARLRRLGRVRSAQDAREPAPATQFRRGGPSPAPRGRALPRGMRRAPGGTVSGTHTGPAPSAAPPTKTRGMT